MPPADDPRPPTRCARPLDWPDSATRPLTPPLQPSVVYRIASLDQVDAIYEGTEPGFVYARDGHPNASALADRLARLECAEAGWVCASGMAAISAAALALLASGSHVALADSLYGRTTTLFARELARFGVRYSLFDAADSRTLRNSLTPATGLVVAETLSNPLLRVADLAGLGEVCSDHDVPLLVDSTFSPLIAQPVRHGATLVVHSLTKLIGGHSDLTLGALLGPKTFIDRAASVGSTFGMPGNPYESWLCARGLATLAIRSERVCSNALSLAQRLADHPGVRQVHYPGLPTHPDHSRACELLHGGFGGILTIDLGNRHRADAFIRSLTEIPFAPSLGDVATTLSHPATTSHRGQPPQELLRLGIHPGLIRLSVGIEEAADLEREILRALDALDA